MNARFASKNGRSGSGRMSMARDTMNLCASKPHAAAVEGTSRSAHEQDAESRHSAYLIIAECLVSVPTCRWPAVCRSRLPAPPPPVRDAADLQQEREPVARTAAASRGNHRVQGGCQGNRHLPHRRARQLPHQSRDDEPALRAQSIAALGEEVDRAEALGLLGVVLHPGARLAAPTEQALSLVSSRARRAC